MRSQTRYARNADVHLAFQVVGEGDLDLLLIDTWVHHVEAVWDLPDFARFGRALLPITSGRQSKSMLATSCR